MYPANRDEILKGLKDLVSCMEKMLNSSAEEEAQQDSEQIAEALNIRFKLIKQIVYQVDNSLGDFQDMLDTMEFHQDEHLTEARQLVNKVEELTAELINYLRRYNQY